MHNVPRDGASHLVMAQGPAVVYGHFVKAVNHPGGGGGRGQQVAGVAGQGAGELQMYVLHRHVGFSHVHSQRRHMTSVSSSGSTDGRWMTGRLRKCRGLAD